MKEYPENTSYQDDENDKEEFMKQTKMKILTGKKIEVKGAVKKKIQMPHRN